MMEIYNKYHREMLRYLKNKKRESWHNLFHQESTFIRSLIVGEAPYSAEKLREASILAQTAFKKLEYDGLVYDMTGDRWYALTPAGEELLASGFKEASHVNIESLMDDYNFHPRIRKVCYKLLLNGHFKEAIQDALVEVINRVKEVSGAPCEGNGRPLDGDALMTRVFGCENRSPLIKLNELNDTFDRDEQRGFMNLYRGIVGIRNKKAHVNFIQNDPLKAIEYLSFASLLMRLLDDDYISQFNISQKT